MGLDRGLRARGEPNVGVERVRGGHEGRGRAEGRPGDQTRLDAVRVDDGQFGLAVMHEGWVGLLVLLGQGHPGLDAEELLARAQPLGRGALGMHDPAAGLHPVHRARLDRHVRAKAVAVMDLALEEIGQRREVDVRVRAHVDALVGQELGGAHLIEEDEGAYHLALLRGQGAAHLHFAQVDRAGDDQRLDGVRARAVAGDGVGTGAPAHGVSPWLWFRWRRSQTTSSATMPWPAPGMT